jgi:uncharacterized protein (DUF58 family)
MDSRLSVDRETLLALVNDARLIANPPGQIPPGALAGERTSKQQGRGLNFDSLRRYQPGDDVRLIDWQATARLRSPWIRLYNEERERPVFLLVDQRLDMFFATRGQTKSVTAAKTAALVFNDGDITLQKCRPPRTSLNTILDTLLHYNQQLPEQYPHEPTSSVSLAEALQRASGAIPNGAWVAVLSDFHDFDQNCDALLAGLRRRCEVSAFVVLDDLHRHLPASGALAATYQGHEAAFTLSSSLNEEIEQSITARLARQQSRLTRLGIRVNHLVVTQDLIKQLQKGI